MAQGSQSPPLSLPGILQVLSIVTAIFPKQDLMVPREQCSAVEMALSDQTEYECGSGSS